MNRVKFSIQPWTDSAEKYPAEIEFEEVEYDRVAICLHCPERMITMSKLDFIRILAFLTSDD